MLQPAHAEIARPQAIEVPLGHQRTGADAIREDDAAPDRHRLQRRSALAKTEIETGQHVLRADDAASRLQPR